MQLELTWQRLFRRAVLPLLLLLAAGGTGLCADTNLPTNVLAVGGTNHPFVLFRSTRWYPMRPPAEALTDNLTLIAFIALPAVLFFALRHFFRRTRSVNGAIGWARLVAGNLLVLLFLVSLLLLGGEIWFRFFVDTTDSLGFTKISERWVRRHWRTNTAGPRDNIEYAPKIQPGKRRVTFVGDSFTAGHGISNVEDRFANRLRATHPDWEVHVLANVGWDTGTEIAMLKKAVARSYELDEVVLVYCLNDVCDLLLAQGQPFEGKLPALDRATPRITHGSYFLDLFYNRHLAAQNPYVKDYFSFVKDGYRGDYWLAQQRRFTEFRELVTSHGGHLSVVTFPFLHALGPKYDYAFVHEALDHFWRAQGVAHLDLLPKFQGLPSRELTVNPHDAHPNERASRLAAEAINQTLWPTFTNHAARVR